MLAFDFFAWFKPVNEAMAAVLNVIHSYVPSYGVDMILLAVVVRLALFPLAQQQFKSMAAMQKVQPLLKQLQAKYKGQPQELQAATMALYKEHGANPLAGCLPLLIQFPILIGLYNAIQAHHADFVKEGFLWIGSPLSHAFPQIFAVSLGDLDFPLFILYIVSMYLTVRYGSPPSTDPQQAQTQKMMAFISPAMIAVFGFKYHWASALLIYWLVLNALTMSQQLWNYRRMGIVGGPKTIEGEIVPNADTSLTGNGKSGSSRQSLPAAKPTNGSTSKRASRRSKR